MASLPPAITPINIAKSSPNKNGPDHKFQVNHNLLYEREFGGETYVSAHLQRLQNGCFNESNLHDQNTLHVSFAAVSFTFHPAVSECHRFKSAIITITANSATGKPLRFLKFAPRLAFGNMTSSSLKWNFQLGASIGVSRTPAEVAIKPQMTYEKNTVVGTEMKIQGSTRSTSPHENVTSLFPSDSATKLLRKIPDTKLVWSLEENSQQGSGLPREFTFAFLMERLHPGTKSPVETTAQIQERELSSTSTLIEEAAESKVYPPAMPAEKTEKPEKSLFHLSFLHHRNRSKTTATSAVIGDIREKHPLHLASDTARPPARSRSIPEGETFDGIRDEISQFHHSRLRSQIEEMLNNIEEPDPEIPHLDFDYVSVFQPIIFSISVQPRINGSLEDKIFEYNYQRSIIAGEVGQKFPTALGDYDTFEGEHKEAMINGLYNFAKLPGDFEHLVELPGNSVTSVEPTLSGPKS